MEKIITISRQFGSGGRTVGKEVAAKLSIPCYDSELIEKVAEESGFAKDYIREHGEYTAHRTWFGRALNAAGGSGGLSNQDVIWIAQRKVILDLAEKGACVFVGRCADFILKGRKDLLTVFIHADDQARAERIVRLYGESEENPEKRLKDKDKRRSAYYKYYTDTEWGVAANYDISLDSGKFGIERCVEIITQLY